MSNQREFRTEKTISRKMVVNYMPSGKIMIICLIDGQTKKIFKMFYYPKADNYCRNKIKFELDLPNYKTKSEVKKSNWC